VLNSENYELARHPYAPPNLLFNLDAPLDDEAEDMSMDEAAGMRFIIQLVHARWYRYGVHAGARDGHMRIHFEA